MSDKRSTLPKLKKSFRIPIRLRRNRHEEAIDALEGPLPPFLQAPPPRADVQVLQKEWQFKERRTELIEHLDSLYEKAYEFDKPLVDPTAYNKLKIRCETLDLGDDGECENGIDVPNFFVPFPLETLMEHRIVTPDEETKRDYEAHEDIFDRTKNGFESRAPYFRLIWHFECFRRSGIPDGPGRLIDITVWRKQLYDFSTPETLSSSTPLFMQWMASKPGGNTSGFPLEDFEPFEEDDDTELSGKKEIEKISDAP
ncbi:hypothetical protein BA78_6882 [Aspergillus fumigatus]|nr:hypothetical protein BA78_6882 [Aspergillus fumigatus]